MGKRKASAHYNRQTSKYRKNVARGNIKRAGVKPPKFRNNPLLKKVVLAAAAIWVVAAIATLFINIHLALLVLLVGVIGASCVIAYINSEDKKIIDAYIKLGLDKKTFNNALEGRRTDPKQIARINKLWDKVEKKNAKQ